MSNRFVSFIRRGIAGIQQAYQSQKRQAEERASRRVSAARTQLQKERAKAELALELARLEREKYEAMARVRQERASVAEARKRAGVVTVGEQLRRAGRDIGRSGMQAYRALSTTSTKKKRRGKGLTVAQRRSRGKSGYDDLLR